MHKEIAIEAGPLTTHQQFPTVARHMKVLTMLNMRSSLDGSFVPAVLPLVFLQSHADRSREIERVVNSQSRDETHVIARRTLAST